MAQQKKGFITRLLEGKEKSEEYARSTLPTNRWQLFWDVFKGNFGKIVKINLLTLLFFVPLIVVIVFSIMMDNSNAVIYPFGANLGVGYPAAPDLQGVSEWLVLQNEFVMFVGLVLSSFIAAVGLAGGMYVIRNMVWTEGIFVANDFWRGVKLNYKNALQAALFFTLIFALSKTMINFADFTLAVGDVGSAQRIWLKISETVSYVFIALAAAMALWMVALGVNYKMKFFTLLRNSFLMVIGTLPQTLFFGLLAVLPFLLFFLGGTLFLLIAILIVFLFAFSYLLLVWLDFAQWVFDKYINPKIEGAKVGRGIFNKDGTSSTQAGDSGAEQEYKRVILSYGRSRLVARPIKPIDDGMQVYELPEAFTREDLAKLRASKKNIVEDTEKYAEEHKHDLRYVEYNKQFDERERAIQDDDKGKKKKRRPPKLLGQ